jgi:formamidopyrimidine-DNA glycosylase
MPELPEVEVVKRGLEEILSDHPRIEKIEIMRPDLRELIPIKKLNSLLGARVISLERRAKYLIIWTEKGGILSHLGMTGSWRVAPFGEERLHDHIYLYFSGNLRLAYRDPRRFGLIDFIKKPIAAHKKLAGLGPEPFGDDFCADYLKKRVEGKGVPIKAAIMDQKIVVGVGNIYANEALFSAEIRPSKPANKVSQVDLGNLITEIRKILLNAIEMGGSTISDFEKTSGEAGYFQNSFKVYGREGEPCLECHNPIKLQVLSGRSTFWCSRCQN